MRLYVVDPAAPVPAADLPVIPVFKAGDAPDGAQLAAALARLVAPRGTRRREPAWDLAGSGFAAKAESLLPLPRPGGGWVLLVGLEIGRAHV